VLFGHPIDPWSLFDLKTMILSVEILLKKHGNFPVNAFFPRLRTSSFWQLTKDFGIVLPKRLSFRSKYLNAQEFGNIKLAI
jgi:hypothetical protein